MFVKMKKIIFTTVIALLSFTIIAQERKVAIFEPAGNANSAVKEIVRELISSVVVNANGYSVLERQLINKVLEEHRIQVGGLVDDSQVIELGKLMGANYAFVTSITMLDRNHFISVKMIDVQTARIEKQSTGQTQNGTNDLVEVVQTLASGMVGQMVMREVAVTEPALIHIYRTREGLLGTSGRYDVLLDNVVVGRTASNWKTALTVNSFGKKTLSATIDGRSAKVDFDVVPGGVYYIRCGTTSQTRNTGRTTTTTDRNGRRTVNQVTETLYTPTLQFVDKSIGENEFNAINPR
jgi:hypothetical protein